jgi:hypothetical protein
MNNTSTIELAGVKTLETTLKSASKTLTVGDVASLTGLNIDEAKRVLEMMLAKYQCKLKVTENGDLIYDFGDGLHLRGEKTFKEYWNEFLEGAWIVFKIIFKIWIVVTLVVYFLIFLVILIAIIIGTLSSSDSSSGSGGSSSSSSSSSSSGFSWAIWDIFSGIFDSRTTTNRTYREKDKRGYEYQHYEPRQSTLAKIKKQRQQQQNEVDSRKKDKGFIASVYDFVFGPPRVELHPLENYMEVASYLRKQKGVVVKSEIIGLAGWSKDEAENFFADCLARFNGKPDISDNGILVGDFEELTRSANQGEDIPVVWFWNEYEAPYEITGNGGWSNTGIIFMNLFNLAFASFFTLGWLAGFDDPSVWEEIGGYWVGVGLGLVPFVFSFIFFLVPISRIFRVWRLNKKRRIQNIRKRLMRVIFQSARGVVTTESLTNAANANAHGEEALDKELVDKVMNELVFDLGGEMKINAQAQTEYHFESLSAELSEIAKIRQQKGGVALGQIVFEA